jgi:hypothetical protein
MNFLIKRRIKREVKMEPTCWLEKIIWLYERSNKPLTDEDRFILKETKKEVEKRRLYE